MRQPKIVLPVLEDDTEVLAAQHFTKQETETIEKNGNQKVENPAIPNLPEEKKTVLSVSGYSVAFDETLLENVAFEIKEGEKVAIVGPNGTGKTTLLRDIYKNNSGFISFAEGVKTAFLSQNHGEMLNENNTIYEEFERGCETACIYANITPTDSEHPLYRSKEAANAHKKATLDSTHANNKLRLETHAEIAAYLKDYYFEPDVLDNKIEILSGGEKNLLQLAKIGISNANFLLLDEPTSHLDTYSQIALEKAIEDYKGTILMVSHDFYSIANLVDYVLFVENKSVRRMRVRSFRKMIYEHHFNKDYLELEQKKKELEGRIENLLKENEFLKAKLICEELESIVEKM